MSALLLGVQSDLADPMSTTAQPRRLLVVGAALVGALAPWALLVITYRGIAQSAAACFAGPMPI